LSTVTRPIMQLVEKVEKTTEIAPVAGLEASSKKQINVLEHMLKVLQSMLDEMKENQKVPQSLNTEW